MLYIRAFCISSRNCVLNVDKFSIALEELNVFSFLSLDFMYYCVSKLKIFHLLFSECHDAETFAKTL